jgi:hypothetical protein
MVHFCSYIYSLSTFVYETFEDIKGLIRSRKSKTDRQYKTHLCMKSLKIPKGYLKPKIDDGQTKCKYAYTG